MPMPSNSDPRAESLICIRSTCGSLPYFYGPLTPTTTCTFFAWPATRTASIYIFLAGGSTDKAWHLDGSLIRSPAIRRINRSSDAVNPWVRAINGLDDSPVCFQPYIFYVLPSFSALPILSEAACSVLYSVFSAVLVLRCARRISIQNNDTRGHPQTSPGVYPFSEAQKRHMQLAYTLLSSFFFSEQRLSLTNWVHCLGQCWQETYISSPAFQI